MAWALAAVGAAMVLGGILGGSKQGSPSYINVKYPEPDPVEQEIAKMQLDSAKKLYDKIQDPTLMRDIYKLLPETKMGEDDRARFTNEYAEISKQATMAAVSQVGKAAGEDLDSQVARGVMTQGQADRQRVQNEAQIKAMMSVLDKRLEASRIGFARNAWMQDQTSHIGAASAISKVDQANKSLLNATVESGLNYFTNRAKNAMAMQSSMVNANLGTYSSNQQTKSDFMNTALAGATKTGLGAYNIYQTNSLLDAAVAKGDMTASQAALYKSLRG